MDTNTQLMHSLPKDTASKTQDSSCPKCQGLGYTGIISPWHIAGSVKFCECIAGIRLEIIYNADQERKRLESVIAALARANVPALYQNATLKSLEKLAAMPEKARAVSLATELATTGKIQGKFTYKSGLYVSGAFGTGKTWLCSAILNTWIAQGRDCHWESLSQATAIIQNEYKQGGSSFTPLSRYQTVECLLLDEIGDVEDAQETKDRRKNLGLILDARKNAQLPTLLTGNMSTAQLASAGTFGVRLTDRLAELCALISMSGENLRQKPEIIYG